MLKVFVFLRGGNNGEVKETGTGHHLNLENAEEFNRVVLNFLKVLPIKAASEQPPNYIRD